MVKSFVKVSSSSKSGDPESSPVPASSSETTAILFSLNVLYKSSNESASNSKPFKALANCS